MIIEKVIIKVNTEHCNSFNYETNTKELCSRSEAKAWIKINRTSAKKYGLDLVNGIPDYFYFDNDGDKVFVECKSEKAGLSYDQLKWIQNNEDKYKIRVIFTFVEEEENPFREAKIIKWKACR